LVVLLNLSIFTSRAWHIQSKKFSEQIFIINKKAYYSDKKLPSFGFFSHKTSYFSGRDMFQIILRLLRCIHHSKPAFTCTAHYTRTTCLHISKLPRTPPATCCTLHRGLLDLRYHHTHYSHHHPYTFNKTSGFSTLPATLLTITFRVVITNLWQNSMAISNG